MNTIEVVRTVNVMLPALLAGWFVCLFLIPLEVRRTRKVLHLLTASILALNGVRSVLLGAENKELTVMGSGIVLLFTASIVAKVLWGKLRLQ